MEDVTAKEIYIFSEYCIELQKENIETLKVILKGYATRHIKQDSKIQKKKVRNALKESEEKIDFLENTKNIILALYEKLGKTLEYTEEEKKACLEKFKLDKESNK